jgi:hypothetical protein
VPRIASGEPVSGFAKNSQCAGHSQAAVRRNTSRRFLVDKNTGLELFHARGIAGRTLPDGNPPWEVGCASANCFGEHRHAAIRPIIAGMLHELPRYPVPGPPSRSRETPRRVAETRRIDDRAMRCNQNPLKTNAQRHSYSRTPLAAMLYSRRVINVLHSRSVHRTKARHRLPYRPHVRYLFAKFATSRPDRRQPPRSPAIGRI